MKYLSLPNSEGGRVVARLAQRPPLRVRRGFDVYYI